MNRAARRRQKVESRAAAKRQRLALMSWPQVKDNIRQRIAAAGGPEYLLKPYPNNHLDFYAIFAAVLHEDGYSKSDMARIMGLSALLVDEALQEALSVEAVYAAVHKKPSTTPD